MDEVISVIDSLPYNGILLAASKYEIHLDVDTDQDYARAICMSYFLSATRGEVILSELKATFPESSDFAESIL